MGHLRRTMDSSCIVVNEARGGRYEWRVVVVLSVL